MPFQPWRHVPPYLPIDSTGVTTSAYRSWNGSSGGGWRGSDGSSSRSRSGWRGSGWRGSGWRGGWGHLRRTTTGGQECTTGTKCSVA